MTRSMELLEGAAEIMTKTAAIQAVVGELRQRSGRAQEAADIVSMTHATLSKAWQALEEIRRIAIVETERPDRKQG